jgi:hypothetical protein
MTWEWNVRGPIACTGGDRSGTARRAWGLGSLSAGRSPYGRCLVRTAGPRWRGCDHGSMFLRTHHGRTRILLHRPRHEPTLGGLPGSPYSE